MENASVEIKGGDSSGANARGSVADDERKKNRQFGVCLRTTCRGCKKSGRLYQNEGRGGEACPKGITKTAFSNLGLEGESEITLLTKRSHELRGMRVLYSKKSRHGGFVKDKTRWSGQRNDKQLGRNFFNDKERQIKGKMEADNFTKYGDLGSRTIFLPGTTDSMLAASGTRERNQKPSVGRKPV